MANYGNLANENPLAVNLGNSPCWLISTNEHRDHPLVADYSYLAMGHPLVADYSNMLQERPWSLI